MAQFFGLMALNAENFESGNAASGEVLTADGSGGAAWEAPAGGASFVFDGADIVLSEVRDGFGHLPWTLTLTSGGVPIAVEAFTTVWIVVNNAPFYSSGHDGIEDIDDRGCILSWLDGGGLALLVHYAGATLSGHISSVEDDVTFRIAASLPGGGVALSNAVYFAPPPPP